jgi:hypothetical protein
LQISELFVLLWCYFKSYTDGAFHWKKRMCKYSLIFKSKKQEQRFLPVQKDWVSVLSIE